MAAAGNVSFDVLLGGKDHARSFEGHGGKTQNFRHCDLPRPCGRTRDFRIFLGLLLPQVTLESEAIFGGMTIVQNRYSYLYL